MNMPRFIALVVAAFLVAGPAAAQWQAPNHSVPVGRGAGVTGFGSVGPCPNGTAIVGRGASADPTCGTVTGAVRVVTAVGAVSVTTADYLVVVNKTTGAATVVNLPAFPNAGDTYVIKDGKGDASVNNITVTPAAGTVDGASNFAISVNYGAVTVVYNGTQWNII